MKTKKLDLSDTQLIQLAAAPHKKRLKSFILYFLFIVIFGSVLITVLCIGLWLIPQEPAFAYMPSWAFILVKIILTIIKHKCNE